MARRLKIELLEGRRLLVSDWQNPDRIRDVNSDHSITPLDALLGINRLNEHAGPLPARTSNSTEPFYDVNGDGFASPIDVLVVVNSLNGGLLVDAALANDTGTGTDAGHDALTNDLSIRGHVQGEPDFVQLRLNSSGQWQDVPGGVDANGDFSLSSATIDSLFGALDDGNYVLQVRAGYDGDSLELADRTIVQWRLDRTPPTSRFIGEILMDDPNRLVIPLSEQVSSESIATSSIKLFDISWGEQPAGSPWGTDGNLPSFRLQPRSISLSESGRALIIKPPVVDRSIKYMVTIDAALEDFAGNKLAIEGNSTGLTARANYFAPNPLLQFNTTYSYPFEMDPKIVEFTIKVDRDDVLIWSGDQTPANTSRYELFDEHGTLLHVLSPSTPTVPGEAASPAYWPVVAGHYYLRKIDPPVSGGSFRVYLASQLPQLRDTNTVTESDNWPIDFYQANLSADESVYFESQSSVRSITTVFNPLGERTPLTVPQGNDQALDASLSGTYIFVARRINFKCYRSSSGSVVQAAADNFDGQLKVPGQRQQVTFATTPGEFYSIDATSSDPGIEFEVDVPQIDSREWVFAAQRTSITITAKRTTADTSPLVYQLRLTKLSNAPALPLNTLLDSPPISSTKYYRGTSSVSDGQVLLDGDNAYTLIKFDNSGNLGLRQGDGPLVVSNLDDSTLVRVKATRSSLPWTARTVETISQSLDLDQLTTLDFKYGLERYELAINAGQDEILTLASFQTQVGQSVDIVVLDAGDAPARSFSSEWPSTSVQFLHPGLHRLVISGQGASSRGIVRFVASSSESWPALPLGVTQTIARNEQSRFKLAAGLERLYLHTVNARDNSTWIVANQRGEIVQRFEIREGALANDLELQLSPLDQHYLIATSDDNSFRGPFEFVSLPVLTDIKPASLGQQVAGQLASTGDRVIVRYDLERGQRVQLASLGIDTASVKFEWKSGLGPVTLNEPWLVPVSMTYELVLTSHSTTAQAYVLNLALAPTLVLGHGISGFGVVRSGVVTNAAYSFLPFEVEAGAMFMLDWQLGDASVEVAIVAPGGNVVQTQLYSDTNLIRAETSGVYFVRLLAYFEDSQPYRFVMRDLSTSSTIGLGEVINGELAPFESRLLQLPLSTATSLLPPDDSQNGVRTELHSSLPGGQTGNAFAAGRVAVLIVNETSSTAPMNVVIQSVSSLELLELEVPKVVQLGPGTLTTYRFATSEPNSDVGLQLSVVPAAVLLSGELGEIQPSATGLFRLPYAGEYRLSILMPSEGESESATLLLSKSLFTSIDYILGSTVSDTVPAMGFERRYAFTLAAGSPVMFGFSGISSQDVRLNTADGRLLSLTSQSDWRAPSLQYLASGSYVLTIIAPRDQFTYSLYLQSLSAATAIQPGDHQGQLSDQELFRIYRYESVQPEQLTWMNSSEQPQFVRLLTASGRQASSSELLRVDSTHPLLVIVQGPSTAYEFSLLQTIRTEYDLPVGQSVERVVSSAAETQVAKLQVAVANLAIEFTSGSASAVLIKPDGSKIPLKHSQVSIVSGLVAGLVTIEISTRDNAASYSLKTASLDGIASVGIGSTAELVPDTYYRLEVPSSGQVRSQLLDGENRVVALSWLQAWNSSSQFVDLQDLTRLEQGNYWLHFNSPQDLSGPFRLRLTPVNSEVVGGRINEPTRFVLGDGIDEVRVQIPVSAGGLLALADSSVSQDTQARYRFIPASGSLEDNTLWQDLGSFPGLWPVGLSGTVEFEFRGSGTSVVRLVDLRQTPALVAGQEQTVSLEPATRIQAWRMPTDLNWSLQFTRLESTENVASWYLVDSKGQLHTPPGKSKIFSAVNSAPLYLIAVIPSSLLATSLTVRVDLAV